MLSFEELGLDGVLAEGKTLAEGLRECVLRACRRLGVSEATRRPRVSWVSIEWSWAR